jgi:hypothetical protein
MASSTERQPSVEAFPLNTSGNSYGAEIDRVCAENELIISVWSPIHLRTKLRELYWKPDKVAVVAMAFWEDVQRYLYLPRLLDREVLGQAIVKGAGTKDFFGTAYGQSGETFEGFKFGDSNVQLDNTLLLIEPEAAKQYEALLAASAPRPQPGQGSGGVGQPAPAGGVNEDGPKPTPGQAPAPGSGKARAFYGSAEVKASTAKMRLVQIAEEIVNVLASDPNATLKITVEINAEYPAGASDQIKRAVSENAANLGFKTKNWE